MNGRLGGWTRADLEAVGKVSEDKLLFTIFVKTVSRMSRHSTSNGVETKFQWTLRVSTGV